jgi:hypothetical protein
LSGSRDIEALTTEDSLAIPNVITTLDFSIQEDFFMEPDWNALNETIDFGDGTISADFWQSDDSLNLSGNSSVDTTMSKRNHQRDVSSSDSDFTHKQAELRSSVSYIYDPPAVPKY